MDIEGRVKELTALEARNEEMVGTINDKVEELEGHKRECEDRVARIEEFLTAAKLLAKASTADEIAQFDSDLDNAEADL